MCRDSIKYLVSIFSRFISLHYIYFMLLLNFQFKSIFKNVCISPLYTIEDSSIKLIMDSLIRNNWSFWQLQRSLCSLVFQKGSENFALGERLWIYSSFLTQQRYLHLLGQRTAFSIARKDCSPSPSTPIITMDTCCGESGRKIIPCVITVYTFVAWRHTCNCVYWLFLLTRSATELLNLTFNLPLHSTLITEQLNLTYNLSLNSRLILQWDRKCLPVSDFMVILSSDTDIYHTVCTLHFLQNCNAVLFYEENELNFQKRNYATISFVAKSHYIHMQEPLTSCLLATSVW